MRFTFEYIETEYRSLLAEGYDFVDCKTGFDQFKKDGTINPGTPTAINRIDVDFSLVRAARLGDIFQKLGIPATFFIRLHAKEYNPFDFENFRHLKGLQARGFEIGYHSEIIDQAAIWGEDPASCLRRDLDVLQTMIDAPVAGIASHGGLTGLNNLDFWKDNNPEDFGATYEAYQHGVMEASRYVSDSEWIRWKAYNKGQRLDDDARSPSEHARQDKPDLMTILIHPDTYYERHFYE